MDEQKKLRNTLDIEVNVDTDEAHEKIKELTAAANECVDALEKLDKVLGKFTSQEPVKFPPILKPMMKRMSADPVEY